MQNNRRGTQKNTGQKIFFQKFFIFFRMLHYTCVTWRLETDDEGAIHDPPTFVKDELWYRRTWCPCGNIKCTRFYCGKKKQTVSVRCTEYTASQLERPYQCAVMRADYSISAYFWIILSLRKKFQKGCCLCGYSVCDVINSKETTPDFYLREFFFCWKNGGRTQREHEL